MQKTRSVHCKELIDYKGTFLVFGHSAVIQYWYLGWESVDEIAADKKKYDNGDDAELTMVCFCCCC